MLPGSLALQNPLLQRLALFAHEAVLFQPRPCQLTAIYLLCKLRFFRRVQQIDTANLA